MPRYLRSQVKRFVVLFEGRVGSTYLITAIARHPQINAMREILDPVMDRGIKAQLAVAQRAWTPSFFGRYKAVGFKTKLRVIQDPAAFAKLIEQQSVYVIHMQRRNVVKSVVSTINAMRLKEAVGLYNVYDEKDLLPPPTIELEKFEKHLALRLELNAALDDYVVGLRQPKLKILYEELLVDEQATFDRIYDFLGVSSHPVQGRTVKITSDDLRQAMVNFDELRAHYAGTPYEAMFDEVLLEQ